MPEKLKHIIKTQPKRAGSILAWALYDFGNSAYFSVVLTFIIAAYFISAIAQNEIEGTHLWGNAVAIAGIIVAIMSPIFGAIADHGGHRKLWLFIFTYFGIIATALIWFAYPETSYAYYTLSLIVISSLGFEIGIVFYNALLPSVAPEGYLGRVSGWAWGLGYAGGILCLCITLFGFVKGQPQWLGTAANANVRIAGPIVASWVAVFSLPLFLFVADIPSRGLSSGKAIKAGLTTLKNTLKSLPSSRSILIFLIARMIYIDGLNTLFVFGGIYAAGTFKMSIDQVAEFGILLNITAGLGAFAFAWFDDWFGAKKTIVISLVAMILIGIIVLTIHSSLLFWLIAPILGIFVGPTQAASRSLMARLSRPEQMTEMFGLYALSGKASAFVGPWLVGTVTYLSNSQRIGMAVIFIFFFIGGALLLAVEEKPPETRPK